MRRFQFTLRTLLVLMTLCCLIFGLVQWIGLSSTLPIMIAAGLVLAMLGEVISREGLLLWGGVVMAVGFFAAIAAALLRAAH